MPSPLRFPPEVVAVLALTLLLAGCQPGSSPRAVPSVPQIGGDLKCQSGDHPFGDPQAGWEFCYPDTWRYTERSQGSTSPPGLDLTFDVTYVPHTPAPCASGSPGPCPGDFAFMIISTYDHGDATDLTGWINTNLPKAPPAESISWGNALEAVKLADGRRIAFTPHHVVLMDLHSGLLDLESQMSTRLGTWKFVY